MSIDVESSLSGAKRRLADLREFQLPRLEKCTGPVGLHRELAEEMRADLNGVRRSLEVSRELAQSVEKGDTYLDQVDLLDQDLADLRTKYREALIVSKRAISSRASSRRHELLASRSNGEYELKEPPIESQKAPARSGTSTDDALQTKTNEVTDALRRTTTLMQAELERSVLSVQMLDESTRTIQLTQTLYDNYTSLLTTSGQLVRAIEKADWYDRLLIFAAFFLFLLTVGWVIKRRVLDKLVGGVGWWVGGSYKLVKMALGGKTGKDVAKAVGGTAGSAGAAGAAALVGSEAGKKQLHPIGRQGRQGVPAEPSGILDEVISTDNPSSAVNKGPRDKDEL